MPQPRHTTAFAAAEFLSVVRALRSVHALEVDELDRVVVPRRLLALGQRERKALVTAGLLTDDGRRHVWLVHHDTAAGMPARIQSSV